MDFVGELNLEMVGRRTGWTEDCGFCAGGAPRQFLVACRTVVVAEVSEKRHDDLVLEFVCLIGGETLLTRPNNVEQGQARSFSAPMALKSMLCVV